MLDRIKSAVEYDDHFAVDDGSGRPFRVAKAALSPAMADRVRRMFAGGTVARMAVGGMVDPALMAGTVLEETPDKTADVAPLEVVIPPPPVQVDQPSTPSVVAPVVAPVEPLAEVAAPVVTPVEQPAEVIAPVVAPAAAPVVAPPAPVAEPVAPAAPVVAAAPAMEAPPTLPAPIDVAAQLGAVRQTLPAPVGVAPAEAAAIQAAVDPAAKARIEREAAEERARRADLELARQTVIRQQQDAAEAERLAADLANVARQHQEAKATAEADYKRRADDYRKDVESSRVEAGRIWSSMNLFQQMLAGISMIAGGAVAGVTGRANQAAEVIETAITRDVEQQRLDIASRQSLRLREYQEAGATLAQASKLVEADQLNLSAAKARATGALQTSRASRDAFDNLAAKLEAKRAAAVETALNDMAAAQTAQVVARNAAQRDALALTGEVQRQRLAAAADVRAEKQLGLAQAQLGLQRQELAEKKAERVAEKMSAAAVGQIGAQARTGFLINPSEWAVLPQADRTSFVPVKVGDKTYYRAANSEQDAKEWKAAAEAKAEVFGALGQITQFLRTRPRVDEEGRPIKTVSTFMNPAAQSVIESATKAMIAALGKMAKAGALSESEEGRMTAQIPTAQAWFASDATEEAKAKALEDRVNNLFDAYTRTRLVDVKGVRSSGGEQ